MKLISKILRSKQSKQLADLRADPVLQSQNPLFRSGLEEAQYFAGKYGVGTFGDFVNSGGWNVQQRYPGYDQRDIPWAEWQHNGDDDGFLGTGISTGIPMVDNIGSMLALTGGFGGMTGYNAATGGNIQEGIMTDLRGLSIGSGLANMGLGTAAGAAGASTGGAMMPPAVPETAATLKGWGLVQSAPGVWSMGGNTIGSLMPPAVPEADPTFGGMVEGSGATTSAVSNPYSGVEQVGHATGSDPFVMESQLLPGGTPTEGFDFQIDPNQINWGEVDLSRMGGPEGLGLDSSREMFANNLSGAARWLKDPLAIGGSLYQIMQSKKMEEDMRNFLNAQQGREFPHQNFYGYADKWMDPSWRYQQLESNPAFRRAEDYLAREQRRQLASKGVHSQVNERGNFSNNFAVPMGDVMAKNANKWDEQLFGQIRDLTGMNQNKRSSDIASQFLPAIHNSNRNAWGEFIGNANKALGGGGLIDSILRNW